ncbi:MULTISPECIES: DUF4254 domain-containing protein [Streptomyces]|uniref:DUF4254 domain-containing protein n=1 Tax=Streptomyces TaxID=1883 RepID=UPI002248DB20|nr:DUF4254 domain-containing protein [Streptomyces sp. JHD 1]MCX2969778.1 DUF4254 domain-containing protein [Streptomyces sp. JHD 1]
MTNGSAEIRLGTGQRGGSSPAAAPTVASRLDRVDGLLEWCQDALDGMPSPRSPELLRSLGRLHVVNSWQWDAEDRVRQVGDDEIPTVKREIDELNSLRHELIEHIDRVLSASWQVDDSVPPLTESMGSALDRLSVLSLRIAQTRRRAGHGAEAAERIEILRRQRHDLVWSIAVACGDLASGRRRTPRPERMKLYGESER